jgi:glucose/arabinose dehydrogenase
MRMARRAWLLCAGVAWAGWAASAHAAPPQTPTILEPRADAPIDAADVHMETAPFIDVDGDAHVCTDWQVVRLDDPSEVVWVAECMQGPNRVHIHLGDGLFVNTLTGDRQLEPETQYKLRVRHVSSSIEPGDAASAWAERIFNTGPGNASYPLELDDIRLYPQPQLLTTLGQQYTIPFNGSLASLRLEAACCEALLLEARSSAIGTEWVNPPALAMHMNMKLTIRAGVLPLAMPELDWVVTGGDGVTRTIAVPATNLASNASVSYWISSNGSTFVIEPGQTSPTFTTIARANKTPWETAQDFKVSLFAEGFSLPVNIAFLPNPGPNPADPLFYVTELYGSIKVVRRNGQISDFATGLLNFDPGGSFPGGGEAGLTGICVDPTNNDVYATLLWDGDPDPVQIAPYPRVIRLRSTDGGLTASSNELVKDFFPTPQFASHQISTITIGPDGNLYVHMGDAFDITLGVDPDSVNGKILRLTKQGQPVEGNPFYDLSNGVTDRDYVFALGLRNPFGGAWRLSDQSLFKVENGPDVDRLAKVVNGRNYLYDGSNESMANFAIWNWSPAVGPVSMAFVQPEVFSNSGFPIEYAGRAFVTQSGATWSSGPGRAGEKSIGEFVIAQGQESLSVPPRLIAVYNGTGKASCSAIAAGPDGIYFADLYPDFNFDNPTAPGARVMKLSYKLPRDCNANNVDDLLEISSGAAQDCNANFIPDSCEVQAGLVADCDKNLVPDDCQTLAPIFTSFIGGTGFGPFSFNGDCRSANGWSRLDGVRTNIDAGTLMVPALRSSPSTTVRFAFDFRMGNDLDGEGICASVLDASIHPANAVIGGRGPLSGALSLILEPDNGPGGVGPGTGELILALNALPVVQVRPQGNIADNLWRRLEVSITSAGVTVRLRGTDMLWQDLLVNHPVEGYAPVVARLGLGALSRGTLSYHDVRNLDIWLPSAQDPDGNGLPASCSCGDLDFNNDTLVPDSTDLDDYLAVLSGGPSACSTGACDGIDYNNDGLSPDSADLDAFLRVLSGGSCLP